MEVTECRVLCPAQRSEDFAGTKSGLVKFGITKIKRDFGWDFVSGASMPRHIPRQKRPFKCLIPKSEWEHIWFEEDFLPRRFRGWMRTVTCRPLCFVRMVVLRAGGLLSKVS